MTAPCGLIEMHEAYKRGDLETLLGDPSDFPNCRGPRGVGEIILEYAIHHSPLGFIRRLLEHGADPKARTRIDDGATPLEEAEILGLTEAVAALKKAGVE